MQITCIKFNLASERLWWLLKKIMHSSETSKIKGHATNFVASVVDITPETSLSGVLPFKLLYSSHKQTVMSLLNAYSPSFSLNDVCCVKLYIKFNSIQFVLIDTYIKFFIIFCSFVMKNTGSCPPQTHKVRRMKLFPKYATVYFFHLKHT